jgi:hypothetical protein
MGAVRLRLASRFQTTKESTLKRITQQMGVLFSIFILLNGGCAADKKSTSEFQSSCALETNQLSTLNGRWRNLPIPLALREGQFNADDISKIQSAVNAWNKFFLKSQGVKAFEFGTDAAPRLSKDDRPISSCTASVLDSSGDGSFSKDVVIYKYSKWPYTSQRDAIAITDFCRYAQKSNQPIRQLFWATIGLNFEDFFVGGKPVPDLVTNLVHELGHLIGLNHSCANGTGSENFVSCEDTALPEDYVEAVMFPLDESSQGVLKRSLKDNDQYRTNCLYGETAYPWESKDSTTSNAGYGGSKAD